MLKMKAETSLNYGYTMPLDMVQLAVGLVAQEIGFVCWWFHSHGDFRGEGRKSILNLFYDFPSENIYSQYPQCMAGIVLYLRLVTKRTRA